MAKKKKPTRKKHIRTFLKKTDKTISGKIKNADKTIQEGIKKAENLLDTGIDLGIITSKQAKQFRKQTSREATKLQKKTRKAITINCESKHKADQKKLIKNSKIFFKTRKPSNFRKTWKAEKIRNYY